VNGYDSDYREIIEDFRVELALKLLESIREFSIVISVITSESYVIFGPLINGLQ
jgi:hypothetical protein